jgi:hypothetical protein
VEGLLRILEVTEMEDDVGRMEKICELSSGLSPVVGGGGGGGGLRLRG